MRSLIWLLTFSYFVEAIYILETNLVTWVCAGNSSSHRALFPLFPTGLYFYTSAYPVNHILPDNDLPDNERGELNVSHHTFDLLFFLVTSAILASYSFQFYIRVYKLRNMNFSYHFVVIFIILKNAFCCDISFVLYSFPGLSLYIPLGCFSLSSCFFAMILINSYS